MMVAGLGCLVGVVLAQGGLHAIKVLGPSNLPRLATVRLDPPVLLVCLLAMVASGLLLAVTPAFHAVRANAMIELKDGGHTTSGGRSLRLRALLVGAQTALSLVLLVVSGLLLQSFSRLHQVDPGFEPRGLLTVDVQLPDFKYPTEEEAEEVIGRLLETLRAVPGVNDAAAADQLPPFGGFYNGVYRPDRPPETPDDYVPATRRLVSEGFFRTLGTPMLVGRGFQAGDRVGSPPVTVISRALAERLYPGEDPVGKVVVLPWRDGIPLEVVGVVADVKDFGLDTDPRPLFCIPLRQYPLSSFRVALRTAGDPAALVPAVRQAVHAVEKDAALYRIGSMKEWLADSLATSRFVSLLVAVFSVIALTLAATGLYGVTVCMVGERRREIGIRVALGAEPSAILGWVLRRGMLVAGGGVAAGLVAAVAASRLVSSLLFATSPTDPKTYLTVSAVLLLVAVVACLVPARRALGCDPTAILRST
jgi:predicted permease